MSKNLTRKGIAFGAAAALLAGTPAFASVNDTAVSLVPTAGTQYSIVQDNVFDLKSDNSIAALAGTGTLKFLVTDPASKILFDYDENTGSGSDALLSADLAFVADGTTDDTAATIAITAATSPLVDTITITVVEGRLDGLVAGDLITLAGLNAGISALNGTHEIFSTTSSDSESSTADTVVIKADTALTAAANIAAGTVTGTLTEVTKTNELDSAAVIKNAKATLGLAGLTGLTAPTRATDGSFVVATGAQDAATSDTLRLVSTAAAGTSATTTVTAWIDENGNGTIESTEDSSSTRTIVFVPEASAGVVTSFKSFAVGAGSLTGTIAFDAAINVAQLTTANYTVGFGVFDGGTLELAASGSTVHSSLTYFTAGHAVSYDSVNNVLATAATTVAANVGGSAQSTVVAGQTYATQAVKASVGLGGITYSNTLQGTVATVGDFYATLNGNVLDSGSNAFKIRTGTKSVEFTSELLDAYSEPVAAGIPVTVTVTRGNLAAGTVLTAGGKTLTSTSTLNYITFDATTNAAGKVVVSVASDDGTAADAFTINLAHNTKSATNAQTATWNDVTVSNSTMQLVEDGIQNSIYAIKKGGSVTLNWTVADEFGVAPIGTYRVTAAFTQLGTTSAGVAHAAQLKSIPVVNGRASYTVVDDSSVATGSYTVTATLQKENTSLVFADISSTVQATSTIYLVTDVTPKTVSVDTVLDTDAGTGLALEPDTFVAVDARADKNVAVFNAAAYSTDEEYTVSGIVTNAAGAGIPGAVVTLTGEGLAFSAGDVDAIGSITVKANAAGLYGNVLVYAHKSGTIVLTATSGSVAKTASLSVDAPADTAGKTLTITGVTKIASGRTFSVAGKLVDKWGNGVTVTGTSTKTFVVSYTGPGFTTTLPTATDANGAFAINVILGSTDAGIIDIAANYDADASGTTYKAVSAAKQVLAGVSAKITKATTSSAVVKNAKGATIKVVRGSKVATKVATSNSFKLSLKGGTGTVKVYVNGVKVASK